MGTKGVYITNNNTSSYFINVFEIRNTIFCLSGEDRGLSNIKRARGGTNEVNVKNHWTNVFSYPYSETCFINCFGFWVLPPQPGSPHFVRLCHR